MLRADVAARWWLFDGAAVSAFFVVIIVALTVLLALRYMLLTRRSLCHPPLLFWPRPHGGHGLVRCPALHQHWHPCEPLPGTCSLTDDCLLDSLQSSFFRHCIFIIPVCGHFATAVCVPCLALLRMASAIPKLCKVLEDTAVSLMFKCIVER